MRDSRPPSPSSGDRSSERASDGTWRREAEDMFHDFKIMALQPFSIVSCGVKLISIYTICTLMVKILTIWIERKNPVCDRQKLDPPARADRREWRLFPTRHAHFPSGRLSNSQPPGCPCEERRVFGSGSASARRRKHRLRRDQCPWSWNGYHFAKDHIPN